MLQKVIEHSSLRRVVAMATVDIIQLEPASFECVAKNLSEIWEFVPSFGSDLKPYLLCQLHGHCYGIASSIVHLFN